jgi:hypothetical protein
MELLDYIKSVIDRFGCQLHINLVFRPAGQEEDDPLDNEILDYGESEH